MSARLLLVYKYRNLWLRTPVCHLGPANRASELGLFATLPAIDARLGLDRTKSASSELYPVQSELSGVHAAGLPIFELIQAKPEPIRFFAFLISYPFGIYFSFTYTESLYALLTMGTFAALAQQHPVRGAIFSALLAATRVTGIFMVPIVAAKLLTPAWEYLRQGDMRPALKNALTALPVLFIAPLGLAAFMAFLYVHTGDALAFLHIETAWNRTPGDPFVPLAAGLFGAFQPSLAATVKYDSLFLSVCGIAGLAMAGWLLKQRRFGESWFLSATVLAAASTGLVSLERYVLANPVFMIFLFLLLSTGTRKRFLPYFILLGAAVQAYALHLWLEGSPLLI